MKGYTWETCSRVIQAQVKTLQTELHHLFGQNLLGIYLHGSLALGGFQPRRSDIDVLVMTRQRSDLAMKRACLALLLRVSKTPCPIDIHVLVQPELFPCQHSLPCDLHYTETWRDTAQQDLHDGCWQDWNTYLWQDAELMIDLAVLHHAGICLWGRPVSELFPPVSAYAFQEALVHTMQVARDHPTQDPVSFVLNACRVSAYLQDGLIRSKDAGGTWGLAHLPEQYSPLLEQSLALYRGEPLGHVAGRALLEAFAQALMNRLTKAPWLISPETQHLQDEEMAFDARAIERWLDDGAMAR